MKYIGLDVHKDDTVACAISAGGKAVMSAEVRTSDVGLGELHARMNGTEYAVMMESSTYSYVVYRFFERLGIETHVVHARNLRMITDSDKKTDRTDAEWIGRCLRLWKNGEIELVMLYSRARSRRSSRTCAATRKNCRTSWATRFDAFVRTCTGTARNAVAVP